MKNLQFNPYQRGAGRWWSGAEWGGSKKSKPIPASSRGTELKSPYIPILPLLRDGENPRRAKWRGQVEQSKIAIPTHAPSWWQPPPAPSYKLNFDTDIHGPFYDRLWSYYQEW